MTDWSDLAFFLGVARAGNLSAAGRALRVDQTTVSRRLTALEERLGAKLFERTATGLALTAVGRRVLPSAEAMEAEALKAERIASGEDARLAGTVRVTTTEPFLLHNVLPFLGEFQAGHPDIELEFLTGYESLSLARREADVAVRLVAPTEPSLKARRVGHIAIAPYVAKSLVARHGPPALGSGLEGMDVIAYAANSMGWPESKWLDRHAAKARRRLRLTSILAVHAAVRAGLGVGLIPCFLGDADPGLVPLSPPVKELQRSIFLVFHEDVRANARVRAVLDLLATAVAAQRAALEGTATPTAKVRRATAPKRS